MRWWIWMLPLAACSSGTVDLGDDAKTDTEEPATQQTESDQEDEPTGVESFVSDWVGELTIVNTGDEVWGWDDCTGELELDVDADGEVDGDGICEGADDGGWGEPDTYRLDFEGEIDDDGHIEGTLYLQAGSWGDVELQTEADGEDDTIEGDGEGEAVYDGWGEEYVLTLEATFELERD